ncbi:MAG: hypothetical protein PHR16_11640 [Methylovulum sp.]|nr:hypothetical protein [Methylovulum sp.]
MGYPWRHSANWRASPRKSTGKCTVAGAGLPDLKVEQAFELLSNASAERSAGGCTIELLIKAMHRLAGKSGIAGSGQGGQRLNRGYVDLD